jgi:hypothetical protein
MVFYAKTFYSVFCAVLRTLFSPIQKVGRMLRQPPKWWGLLRNRGLREAVVAGIQATGFIEKDNVTCS